MRMLRLTWSRFWVVLLLVAMVYADATVALTGKDHAPFRVDDSEEPRTTELGHGVTWRASDGRAYGYAKLTDGREVIMIPGDATLLLAKLILFGRVSRDRFEFAGHGVCQSVMLRKGIRVYRTCEWLKRTPEEVPQARADGEKRIQHYLQQRGQV